MLQDHGAVVCSQARVTLQDRSTPPAILSPSVAVDSHSNPSMYQLILHRSKTDLTGKGIQILFGRTKGPLCPVVALMNYLSIRPQPHESLFVLQDGTPLTRDHFVQEVK